MANEKIIINYYVGGQFKEKEVDTGTTVAMLRTKEEIPSAASVSVNRIERDSDYVLQAGEYVSAVTNNKTGG
jgi:hypothetical protein